MWKSICSLGYKLSNLLIYMFSIVTINFIQGRYIAKRLAQYSSQKGFWYLPFGTEVLSIILGTWLVWWVVSFPKDLHRKKNLVSVFALAVSIYTGTKLVDILGVSLYYHIILLFLICVTFLAVSIVNVFAQNIYIAITKASLLGYFCIVLSHTLGVQCIVAIPVSLLTLFSALGVLNFKAKITFILLCVLNILFLVFCVFL